MLLLGCLVAWLLGVAPSHETQKGVAGYLLLVALLLEVTRTRKALLVTSSLRSLQVSRVTASQVRVTHLSPMSNSVTSNSETSDL